VSNDTNPTSFGKEQETDSNRHEKNGQESYGWGVVDKTQDDKLECTKNEWYQDSQEEGTYVGEHWLDVDSGNPVMTSAPLEDGCDNDTNCVESEQNNTKLLGNLEDIASSSL